MGFSTRFLSGVVAAALTLWGPSAAQAACRDVLEVLAADTFDRSQDVVGLALTAGDSPDKAIIDHIVEGFPGGTIPTVGNRLALEDVRFTADQVDPSCHIARNASFALKKDRGGVIAAVPVDVYVFFSGNGAVPDGNGVEIGVPYQRGTDALHFIHAKAGGVIAQSGTRIPSAGPHVDRGRGNWTYARWAEPVAGSDAAFSLVLCSMPCDRAIRTGLAPPPAPVPVPVPVPSEDDPQMVDDAELRELFPLAENDPADNLNGCAAALVHTRRDPVDDREDEVGFALLMNADPSPVLSARPALPGGPHLPGEKLVVSASNVQFRPVRGGDPRCHSAQAVNIRITDARRRSTILSQIPVDVFAFFHDPQTDPQRNHITIGTLGAGRDGAVHRAAIALQGRGGAVAGASGVPGADVMRVVRWARPMSGSSALFTLVLCEGSCDAFQPAPAPENAGSDAVAIAVEEAVDSASESVSIAQKAKPRDEANGGTGAQSAAIAALSLEVVRLESRIARMEAQQAEIIAELRKLQTAEPAMAPVEAVEPPATGGGLELAMADNGTPLRVAPRNVRSMRLSIPRAEDCAAVGAWFERNAEGTRDDAFFVRDGSQLRLCKRTGPSWIVVPARESSRAHVVEEN